MPDRVVRVLLVCTALLCVVATQPIRASLTTSWSLEELSAFSTLVVRGHVSNVTTQWDPAVNGLYTYATVDVAETWKGPLTESRIVVKMLGGRIDGLELQVSGQAHLSEGDDVVLWLEVRPRDRTLYPTALWQGVWKITGTGPDALAQRAGPNAVVQHQSSLDQL